MYGVTDYISTYVAYNLGYNLSLNLDFQVYDTSLREDEEDKEDVFSFKADFEEEELIDGEDALEIILPEISDLVEDVHDFTILNIQEDEQLQVKSEEASIDEYDKGHYEESLTVDEYAGKVIESADKISVDEFAGNFIEESFDSDEYDTEQKEEQGSKDEYDLDQQEETAHVDVYDFSEIESHQSDKQP
uniref:Uncharacterized protein n=1 Tax=Euplotes crassus TaxID=5936 RepID=A0A7S3NX97_EUPCR|mmetsp:Transcript_4025/g.3802  ORF Transcript_4025/g.3802 Transcript_4025/m.3802 type:complete len:189 (+) Transcript_4025:259-825(+)